MIAHFVILCFVFLVEIFWHVGVCSINCGESYECAGHTVYDEGGVSCRGYSSCRSSPLIQTDGLVQCSGSKSCFNASTIQRIENASMSELGVSSVHCNAFQSCSFANMIRNDNGDIMCSGEYACTGSTIIVPNGKLICAGGYSCANVVAFVGASVELEGYLSAYNATFYPIDDVEFNFFGVDSGYGASIIGDLDNVGSINSIVDEYQFEKPSTFAVNCYGNACNNMNSKSIACDCVVTTECDFSMQNSVCPVEGYQLSLTGENLFYNLTSILFDYYQNSYSGYKYNGIGSSNYNYSYNSEKNAMYCDDLASCIDGTTTIVKFINSSLNDSYSNWNYNDSDISYDYDYNASLFSYTQDILLDNYNSPIFCNGEVSCAKNTKNDGVHNITTFNVSDSDSPAIVCDGFRSCVANFILSKQGGNVYYRAERDAWVLLDLAFEINLGTDAAYKLFCSGKASCMERYLIDTGNLICSAMESCRLSTIKNVGNVWGLARYALKEASMIGITKDVYCLTHESCLDAIIENVNGVVVGIHTRALVDATIANAPKVICDGHESCLGTTIRSTKLIQANGLNCLRGTLNCIYALRYNTGGFDRVCKH